MVLLVRLLPEFWESWKLLVESDLDLMMLEILILCVTLGVSVGVYKPPQRDQRHVCDRLSVDFGIVWRPTRRRTDRERNLGVDEIA